MAGNRCCSCSSKLKLLMCIQSVSSSTPSGELKRVTSTFVCGTYDCCTSVYGSAGATTKEPPRSGSRMAPKTLGESIRGKQHQSMEPFIPTSAQEPRLPMKPYEAMGWNVMDAGGTSRT